MRRIALLLAALACMLPAIAVPASAAAATTMTGAIERVALRYQGGPILEVYGWAKTSGAEDGNNNLVRVTVTGPDGATVPTAFAPPLLATYEFDNGVDDHPGVDIFGTVVHHGFWTMAYIARPGVYKACAQAAPGHPAPTSRSWTSLGCKSVTLAPRAIDGGITSIGPRAGASGLVVEGWLTDSWDEWSVGGDFEIEYSGPKDVVAAQRPPAIMSGGPYLDAPSAALSAQHPRAVGLRPVRAVIDPAPPGDYRICAVFEDSAAAVASAATCMSARVVSAYATTRPVFPKGSTLDVGSSVSVESGTWLPAGAAVTDRLVWESAALSSRLEDGTIAQAAPGGSMTIPPKAAGRRVCLVETATVTGGVPVSEKQCYLAVLGGVDVTRIGGADRYDTAAAISRAAFPGEGPSTVYITSGTSFADALSVGPVIAKTDSALLLTRASSLPAATRTELSRLSPARIVVIGGAGAVSEAVVTQLRTLAPKVTRIGGANRYETSRKVIASAFPAGSTSQVMIATGRDFPDAVAAVPAAAAASAPIMLVDGRAKAADAATLSAMSRLGAKKVTVLGGTGAVTAGIAASLSATAEVTRVSGANRYDTALAIAQLAVPDSSASAYIASGSAFPDALAAATLQSVAPGAIYLSRRECLSPAVIGDMLRTGSRRVTLLGGTGAVFYDRITACS
ncbi:cell wall-binding repeat-containing protein [Microbacterium sp. NPDC089318]